MDILVISESNRNVQVNGGFHFRTWNLLKKGNANVFYLQQEEKNDGQQKIKNPLSWRNIIYLDSEYKKLPITKSDIFPSIFLTRNYAQIDTLRRAVDKYISGNPNTFVIAYGYAVGLMASTFLSGKFIFDSCDSMSLYFHRRYQRLGYGKWEKKINSKYMSAVYKAVESYIAHHAALYLVTAEADRQWILRGYSKSNIIAIGNGTDWINLPTVEPKSGKKASTISFHGSMNWEPNRLAALYLIREVFPTVRTAFPNARLQIAGKPVFRELSTFHNSNGVEICGFVDDIRSWLAECDVYAMPMLQGSGVKNKLIEAMAAGLPIVTNSLGAEALPSAAKESIVIADGSQKIAQAIIDLLRDKDKRIRLRHNARRVAEKEFNWSNLSNQFMKAIEATNCTN